jgi:hypothetical protein
MSAHAKLLKPQGVQPEPFELQVASTLLDLEAHVPELKADLSVLQITAAKQVNSLVLKCNAVDAVLFDEECFKRIFNKTRSSDDFDVAKQAR